MATNPQPPQDQHGERMTLVKDGTRGTNWVPLVIIIVAAAILAAIITLAQHAPRKSVPPAAAGIPAQPTGGQLQVSNVKLSNLVKNDPATISGTLFNNGATAINAVEGVAIFKGKNGTDLPPVSAPLLGLRSDGSTQPFADNPIQPSERRAFQMQIDHVPQGWDGTLPEFQFPTVTGQSPGKSEPSATSNR